MRNTTRKGLALILAVLQLAVLFPLTAFAEDSTATNETPVLNEMKVGTVQFQSFNFLGDNATGEDGTDYSTTFYYTDDYFAPSAINDAATSRTMLWSDLDNTALATCSMDFAVAAMTSAKDDVLRATSETWNNSVYNRVINDGTYSGKVKERNVREFLSTCGFSNIECTDLDTRPRNDSIGYTIASKEITVWDGEHNSKYTLIAVGVRGAGYGQEWASNITIGNPATGQIPSNGRHFGFDDSAQKVCTAIDTYLRAHNITNSVKYWVTGFSRAAAVANLVAGYLSDDQATFHTSDRQLNGNPDVYAYTWECPQAAKKTNSPDTNFTNYKNIHNILNPMDAVPKVSPDAFNHQRLGVDYQMPFHGHVDSGKINSSKHTDMYNQMFEVLKTIATGSEYTEEKDPLVDDPTTSDEYDGYVSPSKYPYNSPIKIYRVSGSKLMEQALAYAVASDKENAKLLKEFGTEEAEQEHTVRYGPWNALSRTDGNVNPLLGWVDGTDYKTSSWYVDDFIESLIDVFLTSNAWVGEMGTGRTAMQNRATFISDFQPHFRTLFGYFLDLSGPAFLSLIPNVVQAVTSNLGSTLFSPFPTAFLAFYNAPTSKTLRNAAIDSAKPIMHDVIDTLTSNASFPDPDYQHITKQQAKDAMDQLVPLVFNLYAYELDRFNSQYLGTTLRYLNTILCTHEQETVLSWIMSLDSNHMNRNCRTVTIPRNCTAKLLEFRDGYEAYEGGLTDADAKAPVVAEWSNGTLTTKDARITSNASGSTSYVAIRYPASLQIRVDVVPSEDLDLRYGSIGVDDYRTTSATERVSAGESQFVGVPDSSSASSIGFRYATNITAYSNGTQTNQKIANYQTLEAGDTLHIIANGTDTYDQKMTYDLLVDKKPVVTVVDYAAPAASMGSGNNSTGSAVALDVAKNENPSESTINGIKTRQRNYDIPASSVYFDDDFSRTDISGNPGDSVYSTMSEFVSGGQKLYFKFSGSRVDVYCTTYNTTKVDNKDVSSGYVQAAVYKASGDELGDRVDVVTMKNTSDTVRYNVPTLSFDGLTPGQEYYLVLNILNSSNYKLDGIRVYNPKGAEDNTVSFSNVRELLLPSDEAESQEISGVAYYKADDTSLVTETYEKDGPKQEVYLGKDESIGFTVNSGYDVAVGLSAPENKGAGSLTVTDNDSVITNFSVPTVVDTYYDIHPDSDGNVVITNNTDVMVAVTNIRLTPNGMVTGNRAPLMVTSSLRSYTRNFLSLAAAPTVIEEPEETLAPEETPAVEELEVTTAPEQTPEPTPIPTPTLIPMPAPTPTPTPRSITSFINAVFRSISRLFGF